MKRKSVVFIFVCLLVIGDHGFTIYQFLDHGKLGLRTGLALLLKIIVLIYFSGIIYREIRLRRDNM